MTPSPATGFPVRGSPSAGATSETGARRVTSMRRHPSAKIEIRPGCRRCGFRSPPRSEVAAALAGLPRRWQAHLEQLGPPEQQHVHVGIARARNELHAVANRMSRILEAPTNVGPAVVTEVDTEAPIVVAATTDPDQLLARLRLAAERASEFVGALDAGDWRRRARVGERSVTIEELAILPLHRSHARFGSRRPCQ